MNKAYTGITSAGDHVYLNEKRAEICRKEWVEFLKIQAKFPEGIRDRRAKPHRVTDAELLLRG